jgi:hypothetical protein
MLRNFLLVTTMLLCHFILISNLGEGVLLLTPQYTVLNTATFLMYTYISFPVALRPNEYHDLLILEVSRSHTTTHHSQQDSSGRVISSLKRPLPDNTQHPQQTIIHVSGGIRTLDLSMLTAADLRLRLRGYLDRLYIYRAGQALRVPGG